ncbi:GNAT family N-acetyltransferase [Bacillus alveayuensis]|jgi:predicted GNAT superfamily acetyltransferase|uniref:GNAT family N-acetyltransferase n=1 Tax=Aeribacillus alveayuensis TaxID=279215 RepID=UPI000ACB77C7|nr:GNAT family N-acetyltransferase [Bacillus alveayuensis]
MSTALEIRVLKSHSDLQMVQNLEKQVWEMDPLPLHQTITAAQNGGLLLGAFIDNEMVGFSYSFPGFQHGKSYLCSHMLGIHPDHQEKGIGAKLKKAQKEIARDMGYDLIVWTFDPLETRNAYLNLSKLHAICSTYIENCYGEMEDNLNYGLPSDRFKVEWWINSPHVIDHHGVNIEEEPFKLPWKTTIDQLPILDDVEDEIENISDQQKPVLVPVPANFQHLKRENYSLAMEWRLKTRKVFQALFQKGYAAVFLRKSDDEPVHYYLLTQRKHVNI